MTKIFVIEYLCVNWEWRKISSLKIYAWVAQEGNFRYWLSMAYSEWRKFVSLTELWTYSRQKVRKSYHSQGYLRLSEYTIRTRFSKFSFLAAIRYSTHATIACLDTRNRMRIRGCVHQRLSVVVVFYRVILKLHLLSDLASSI